MASYEGDLRLVKCLVSHGADVEAADDTNRTALQWGLKGGHGSVFKYLVSKNADIHRVAKDGKAFFTIL